MLAQLRSYLFNAQQDCTGPVLSSATGERMCTLCDLLRLVNTFTGVIVTFLTIIITVMVLYGAFTMMLSTGDPARFRRGREIIVNALIGAAIVLASYIIVDTLFKVLAQGNIANLGPWNQIQCGNS